MPDYALRKSQALGARPENMIEDPSKWWFNGHVVCNVRPDNVWGEYQLEDLATLIQHALRGTTGISSDFLLNKRDCPLLPRHLPAPPPFHLPVLSPYTSPAVLDIPFPLADDWRLATASPMPPPPPEWSSRSIAKAVFRGSSTGKGIDVATNARLGLCVFAAEHAPLTLDCKITRVNDRDQLVVDLVVPSTQPSVTQPSVTQPSVTCKWPDVPAVTCKWPDVPAIIHKLQAVGAMAPYSTLEQQALVYKFAVYIRGHQAASRLAALFRLGFCVLYYSPHDECIDAPGCDPWFKDLLVDYTGWKGNEARPPAEADKQLEADKQQSDAKQSDVKPASGAVSTTLALLKGSVSSKKRRRPEQVPSSSLISLFRDTPVHSVATTHPTPNPTTTTANVCICATFRELSDCVMYMQLNDGVAQQIAKNGLDLARKVLDKEFICERARQAIVKASHQHTPYTHSLFGVTNFEYVAKKSHRMG